MLRVGREAIVTFPNFGHWSHRLQILGGRMPVSKSLPYQWYDTPNIHLCTVADFDRFLAERRLPRARPRRAGARAAGRISRRTCAASSRSTASARWFVARRRVLHEGSRPPLERVTAPQVRGLPRRNQSIVPQAAKPRVDVAHGLGARHPPARIDAAQVERARVAAQRAAPAPVAELVEVRQRELAQAAVDGVAKAQHDAVGLRDRAPAGRRAEQHDHVRIVAGVAVHVHDQRRPASDPERARGDERAFDAMRAALPQHLAHRQYRGTVDLVIGRDRVDERLDALRRRQARKPRVLARRQAERCAACAWAGVRRALHRSADPLRATERPCIMILRCARVQPLESADERRRASCNRSSAGVDDRR